MEKKHFNIDAINKGFEDLITKIEGWIASSIEMLPNLIVAILTFLFFIILSIWFAALTKKGLNRTHLNPNLRHLLATFSRLFVLILGFILCLSILKLDKAVFSLLAGVGVLGIALGFAFQELASNLISGLFILLRGSMKIGDLIQIKGIMGNVIDIKMKDTKIRNFDGQDIYIPNKEFNSNEFYNYSSFGMRKIKIPVGIGYEDDPEIAIDVITKTLQEVEGALNEPKARAYVESFGDSSVNLIGELWFKFPGTRDSFIIKSEAIIAIKKALATAGLNIPFPIRTIDLNKSSQEFLTGNFSKSKHIEP